MRVGLLARSFESMDGDVFNVEFKLGQVPLEVFNFDGAAGDRLQRRYQLLPHALAKEVAVEIPNGTEKDGKHDKAGDRGDESGGCSSEIPSANPRQQAGSVSSLFH